MVTTGAHGVRARLNAARVQNVVLAALGGVVVSSTVVTAAAHVDDRFETDQVSGTWMALAKFTNEGVLYPPLFNGSHFGGTRFMPLQIVVNAGVARATGDYLLAAKLVSYAAATLLFALTFALVRRISGSSPLAFALVGAILVTYVGSVAVNGVRGDAIPAALQLAAVTLVLRNTRKALALAGLLCALAFISKLSALWAPLTIVLWLFFRQRRLLPMFLGALLIPAGLLLALFQLASDGRMLANIHGLAGAGVPGVQGFLLDTSRRFTLFEGTADVIWLLFPLTIAAVVLAVRRRALTIYHLALLAASGVLVMVLADIGAGANHLLDVATLSAVVVADLWRSAATDDRLKAARLFIVATLVWGIAGSYQVSLRGATIDAARDLLGRGGPQYPAHPLKGVVGARETILSEDPYVSVSRGHDPVILDAFMLLRLLRDHPHWQAQLLSQINTHSFSKVILIEPLNPAAGWFQNYDFGPTIASALARNYRLRILRDGYFVYVPRP